MIKVLYVNTLNLGVSYWRIENYAQEMLKFPNDCRVFVEYFGDHDLPWDKLAVGYGETSNQIQDKLRGACKNFDVIIFQKIQNKEALALLKEYKKEFPWVQFVAEIDDAVGDVPPSNIHNWKDQHTWAAEHLIFSDAVIASTQYLADSIIPIVGKDKPIYVAPNCIHRETWAIDTEYKNDDDLIRIVYTGGGAHDEDLKLVYKPMLEVLEENEKARFVIRYGGFRPDWLKEHKQIDFKTVGWHISVYPYNLSQIGADIALAPLRDIEFNRCKSNVKWLEWATLGVPLVASAIEPYTNNNGNIYLATNDTDDWYEKITWAVDNYSVLSEETLKNQCYSNYNLNKETKRLLTFLQNLC